MSERERERRVYLLVGWWKVNIRPSIRYSLRICN